MARKTQSRKTAKKRGGVRRRNKTARRGGANNKNQIINTDNIYDSNGAKVNIGDLVEIKKNNMLKGTTNYGKYILFSIIDSNVTFVSIQSPKPETKNTTMGRVTSNDVSVHIIKIKYGGLFFGYTVTKQPNNKITIVTYEDDVYTETSTFDSNDFYDYYRYINIPIEDSAIIYLQTNEENVNWDVFLNNVNASIVQKNKETNAERKIVIKNGKREVKEDKVASTNAQPTPKEI
jgi:hypothetical protein